MGTILAVDYGLKHIGFAISDPTCSFAFPYSVIEIKNYDFVLSYIKDILSRKEVELIVVGMPFNMDGSKGKIAKEVENFTKKLKNSINIPLESQDERLSSFAANENLKEAGIKAKKSKMFVHKESARILLEEYIHKKAHLTD